MAGIHAKSFRGKLSDASVSKAVEAEYITGQPIGNSRIGLDVIAMMCYKVGATRTAEAGSTDTLIKLTAHGAKRGDVIRFITSANNISELEVGVEDIIDANTIEVAGILSADVATGDTFEILRMVTPRVDSSGATLAALSGAIKFTYNGSEQDVIEDTVTPANNRPLPVKITSASGDINITAGDLNVQLSHTGASYDSTRIGDGTTLLGITLNNEAKVRDADANTTLSSLLTELQLKADLSETQPVSVASLPLPTGAATEATLAALAAEDFATQTTLAALLTELQLKADLAETQPVSAASLPLPTGAATEATLAAISAQLPATLGQKTMANSLAVVLSSDQSSIPVNVSSGSVVDFIQLDFSLSNVSNGAYTQLIADIGATAGKKVRIFMSSGEPLYLAIGAAAAEVDALIVPPGGLDECELTIPANSRLSLKAVNATTVSAGVLIINIVG